MNKIQSKILFNAYKKHYAGIKTVEELKQAEKAFYACFNNFGIYQGTIKKFLEVKELEFKNRSLNDLIKPFNQVEPLKFNLKGLDTLEEKIRKLNDFKLKYEFEGLFNLLSDSSNLVYNPLSERARIIKDLNKFKSLKFFKVNYLSRYDLKKEFKHLAFKNGADIGHSKVYFIKKGLYIIKTLKKDDISLKVFYVGQKYKTLLKRTEKNKVCPLKNDKFNLSSTDAYKVLNKMDNIKYYSYCNNNGLDKKNRQLLKSIRKSKRISRDSLIESLEDKMEDLEDSINNKVLSETDIVYLELQLQDTEKYLSDLKSHDEDNSIERETMLDDYF